jgi:hypothetical protein
VLQPLTTGGRGLFLIYMEIEMNQQQRTYFKREMDIIIAQKLEVVGFQYQPKCIERPYYKHCYAQTKLQTEVDCMKKWSDVANEELRMAVHGNKYKKNFKWNYYSDQYGLDNSSPQLSSIFDISGVRSAGRKMRAELKLIDAKAHKLADRIVADARAVVRETMLGDSKAGLKALETFSKKEYKL